MEQVLMRCGSDCHIPALANVCGLTYEGAAKLFDGINGDRRDDLTASPLHLDAALRKLRIASRIVTDEEIIAGFTRPGKTIVLVHSPKAPMLNQHYVNVLDVTPIRVLLGWNTAETPVKWVTPEEFRALYRKGFPNYAIEIGTGSIRGLSWYSRFWVWFSNLIG